MTRCGPSISFSRRFNSASHHAVLNSPQAPSLPSFSLDQTQITLHAAIRLYPPDRLCLRIKEHKDVDAVCYNGAANGNDGGKSC